MTTEGVREKAAADRLQRLDPVEACISWIREECGASPVEFVGPTRRAASSGPMSVSKPIERVEVQLQNALRLDLPRIRSDIQAEHERAATATDRVALLAIHEIVMDAAEQAYAGEDLEEFRNLRRQYYRLLLIREARSGQDATNGRVNSQKLAAIARREVEAGRMAPDDDLHTLAVAAATTSTPLAGEEPRAKFLNDLLVVISAFTAAGILLALAWLYLA